MTFFKEFRQFISKGNVIDIAVGVIIGAAFGKISNSLAGDIILPPLGLIMSTMDVKDLAYTLQEAEGSNPAVIIKYGVFIQTILDFLIISFAVFLLVKLFSHFKKKEEAKPVTITPIKTDEAILLEEIRDLLKERK
jgi:large conductance mechanosensitive channel